MQKLKDLIGDCEVKEFNKSKLRCGLKEGYVRCHYPQHKHACPIYIEYQIGLANMYRDRRIKKEGVGDDRN